MTWSNTHASVRTWSAQTATDLSRQFLTLGSIANPDPSVDFVLTVDEAHPIILSDTVPPFVLLQDVMETP